MHMQYIHLELRIESFHFRPGKGARPLHKEHQECEMAQWDSIKEATSEQPASMGEYKCKVAEIRNGP